MRSRNIILLHGWGATSNKLMPLKKALEKKGWNVLLPLLAGFEAPPPDFAWGIKEYSKHVKTLASEAFINKDYVVFGHSFGGRLAIKMATSNTKNLSGIVLCATSGLSRGNPVKRLAFTTLAKTGKAVLVVPGTYSLFRKVLYKAAREHDYEKTQGVMREVFRKVVAEDLKPHVTKIAIPSLVLWGDKDRMTPIADARFLEANLKSGRLIVYKGMGHKLPYEKPKDIAFAIHTWHSTL